MTVALAEATLTRCPWEVIGRRPRGCRRDCIAQTDEEGRLSGCWMKMAEKLERELTRRIARRN